MSRCRTASTSAGSWRAVLRQRCAPHLLHTYSAERQAIAEELIDFDREWAGHAGVEQRASIRPRRSAISSRTGATPRARRRAIARRSLTGEATWQHLAKGLPIGMRFHSAPVIRLADAKPVQLGHVVKADGRWRIFAFAGAEDPAAPKLGHPRAVRLSRRGIASRRCEIHPGRRGHRRGDRCPRGLPARSSRARHRGDAGACCCRAKGRYGLRDYEKMFCADLKSGNDIFAMRGIDRERGCMVVVRPDQYVAHVLPLDGYSAARGVSSTASWSGPREGGPGRISYCVGVL